VYLIWVFHLADAFQGLQQDSRGQGGVHCLEGQEPGKAGRRRGTTKAMRHCGKCQKRQRCLACKVSYEGEVSFWSIFSYFYFPYQFNLMCPLFCYYFALFCPAVWCSLLHLLLSAHILLPSSFFVEHLVSLTCFCFSLSLPSSFCLPLLLSLWIPAIFKLKFERFLSHIFPLLPRKVAEDYLEVL